MSKYTKIGITDNILPDGRIDVVFSTPNGLEHVIMSYQERERMLIMQATARLGIEIDGPLDKHIQSLKRTANIFYKRNSVYYNQSRGE